MNTNKTLEDLEFVLEVSECLKDELTSMQKNIEIVTGKNYSIPYILVKILESKRKERTFKL